MKIFSCLLFALIAFCVSQPAASTVAQVQSRIAGLCIKPGEAPAIEVDVSFTTDEIFEIQEATASRGGTRYNHVMDTWAIVLVEALAAPGAKAPQSVSEYKRRYRDFRPAFPEGTAPRKQMDLLLRQIEKIYEEIKGTAVNVNRPEQGEERKKLLRREIAALTARIFNLVLAGYSGNFEDAIFLTSMTDRYSGGYIFYPTDEPPVPFLHILMSPYEKWASEQVSSMKFSSPAEKIKYTRFLNRLLIERLYSDRATFARKTLGDDFLRKYNKQ